MNCSSEQASEPVSKLVYVVYLITAVEAVIL
jgi:hypothetical protein